MTAAHALPDALIIAGRGAEKPGQEFGRPESPCNVAAAASIMQIPARPCVASRSSASSITPSCQHRPRRRDSEDGRRPEKELLLLLLLLRAGSSNGRGWVRRLGAGPPRLLSACVPPPTLCRLYLGTVRGGRPPPPPYTSAALHFWSATVQSLASLFSSWWAVGGFHQY